MTSRIDALKELGQILTPTEEVAIESVSDEVFEKILEKALIEAEKKDEKSV